MRRSRLTEEQIIGILKEQEGGLPIAEVCRKPGISNGSFYKWKAKFGGMDVSDAKRLKSLEDENAKLTKLLANAMLDIATLKEMLGKKLLTPGSRRQAMDWAVKEKACTQRRARTLASIDARICRYRSSRPVDAALRTRLRELASEHRRFGYGRLHILLRREGVEVNWSEARKQTIQ